MPRCYSRSCTHCFPPGADERRVLDDAIEYIDNLVRYDFDPEYMSYHEDQDQPWFQAMLAAYRAGIARAMKEVQDVRRRFD
jgi:hypothetical protein